MANKYMKRDKSSLIIREKQIKTTVRYYLTHPLGWISKTKNKCWQRCGGIETLYTLGGNLKWDSHYGKQYSSSSKN